MVLPNDEGHRVNGAPQTQAHSQPLHFANDGDDGKALAATRARAARCGCSLHEMSDGAYLLARTDHSQAAPCLRAIGNLLRQIGGRR